MKQIVVIKESSTTIYIDQKYLIVKKVGYSDNVISYRNIKKLYLNKLIQISISDCLKLASYFELYFINQHGNILGRIQIDEKI